MVRLEALRRFDDHDASAEAIKAALADTSGAEKIWRYNESRY